MLELLASLLCTLPCLPFRHVAPEWIRILTEGDTGLGQGARRAHLRPASMGQSTSLRHHCRELRHWPKFSQCPPEPHPGHLRATSHQAASQTDGSACAGRAGSRPPSAAHAAARAHEIAFISAGFRVSRKGSPRWCWIFCMERAVLLSL